MEITETGHIVNARISGRMNRYHIKLAKGDKLAIELPIPFFDRGRIVFRLNK